MVLNKLQLLTGQHITWFQGTRWFIAVFTKASHLTRKFNSDMFRGKKIYEEYEK
jgi:hypothetical protein